MIYLRRTETTGRYELNLFGLKLKFRVGHKKLHDIDQLNNLLYELADSRTFQNLKFPKILNFEDSLSLLINSNKSMSRFGDGEYKLIMGENINFQKYDKTLADRLKNILKNQNEDLLVGITDSFGYCSGAYIRSVMVACRTTLYKYIDFTKNYIDTNLSRRLLFDSYEEGLAYYNSMKSLWRRRKVVVVEGVGTRLGIGNDLLTDASEVKRIVCPMKDAYSCYDKILKSCLECDKDKLFILALGPTATV